MFWFLNRLFTLLKQIYLEFIFQIDTNYTWTTNRCAFSILEAQVEHVDATYSFPENVGIAVLGVRLVNLAGTLQTNVNVR
jgi:hypothetical protein